jgi:CRISPR-associated protein Csm5
MNNHPIIIEALTPLHIGKGESLTSVGEYVATSNRIRIIDQIALRSILARKGIQKEYLAYILDYAKNTHVWDFFKSQNIENDIKYTRDFKLNANAFNPESNNILELATETCSKKYIPGSSLKGALRTLVFASCIGADTNLKNNIEHIISEKDNLYDIRKFILQAEEKSLNDDFYLFRVEDSSLVDDEDIVAEIAKRQHLFGIKTDGLDNLLECIATGTKIKTNITIIPEAENDNLKWMNSQSLTELFQAINLITEQYIDHEIKQLCNSAHEIAKELCKALKELKILLNKCGNQAAFLRLGKGKTFIFQVILPMLSFHSQEKIIRLLVQEPEARVNFPKTRVLTENNQMFGWVKISMPDLLLDESSFFDNIIQEPKLGVTKLKAYFLDVKKVSYKVNGVVYRDAQLINQFKKEFKKGQLIEVLVTQITKEGKINQVKID